VWGLWNEDVCACDPRSPIYRPTDEAEEEEPGMEKRGRLLLSGCVVHNARCIGFKWAKQV